MITFGFNIIISDWRSISARRKPLVYDDYDGVARMASARLRVDS